MPDSQQAACLLHAMVLPPCNSHFTLQAMSALQVMSVGWNPFFKNESKTCEPWLLHEFDTDFYDKELRCRSSWYCSRGLSCGALLPGM